MKNKIKKIIRHNLLIFLICFGVSYSISIYRSQSRWVSDNHYTPVNSEDNAVINKPVKKPYVGLFIESADLIGHELITELEISQMPSAPIYWGSNVITISSGVLVPFNNKSSEIYHMQTIKQHLQKELNNNAVNDNVEQPRGQILLPKNATKQQYKLLNSHNNGDINNLPVNHFSGNQIMALYELFLPKNSHIDLKESITTEAVFVSANTLSNSSTLKEGSNISILPIFNQSLHTLHTGNIDAVFGCFMFLSGASLIVLKFSKINKMKKEM